MSDTQKTIQILQNLPENISSTLSMKELFEILSIMINLDETPNFEPTTNDFLTALAIRRSIQNGLEDIENGQLYTTEQLLKEMKEW